MEATIRYGLTDTDRLAKQLLSTCGPAPIFALSGELGAGKTTLVSALCRALGVTEPTSSPTFSIVNEYMAPDGPVYHLDAYRLERLEEALDAGLEEIFAGDRPIFVEWPAVIEPMLPDGVVFLHLQHGPDGHERLLTRSIHRPDEQQG